MNNANSHYTRYYCICMQRAAFVLGVGPNQLFRYLRENGIFHSDGELKNTPTEQYLHNGFFVIEDSSFKKGATHHPHKKTKLTPKGLSFLEKRFYALDQKKRMAHRKRQGIQRQQVNDGWPDDVLRVASL